jgi:hypothetical protein
MPESPLVKKEAVALADLEVLIADRVKRESETELGFKKRIDREDAEYKATARQLAAKFKVDTESLDAQYARAREEVVQTYARDRLACQNDYAQAKKQIDEQFKKEQRKAKKSKEDAGFHALAYFEASREDGVKWRRAADSRWHGALDELHVKKETFDYVLARCGRLGANLPDELPAGTLEAVAAPVAAAVPEPVAAVNSDAPEGAEETPPVDTSPAGAVRAICARIDEGIVGLEALKLPKFLRLDVFVWPFLLLTAAIVGGLGAGLGVGWTAAAIVGGVVGLGSGIGAYIGLSKSARPAVVRHAVPLKMAVAEADKLVEQNKDWVKTEFETKLKELDANRLGKVRDAEEVMTRKVAEAQDRHKKQMEEADQVYPAKLELLKKIHDEGIKKVEDHFPPRIKALKDKYEKDRRELDEAYHATKTTTQDLYKQTWDKLIHDWTTGMAKISGVVDEVRSENDRRFLDWSRPELNGWKPPSEVPPGMRFGAFTVDLDHFPNGAPRDPRLKNVPTQFELPALLPFPIQGSILIKAVDSGKEEAIHLLQALMLRYLTSIPPGKVRYTIVDPVGLGENFAAFMHLGDYHELLVTNRIWTESQHIEQRLTDLTEHMENVIQKYLRNEFETIEEYNTMAGEVAEPFRILVVANFPTNFNEAALRRLISIVNSGARCGVYALVMYDTKLGLPSGFQLKELENPCVNMIWKEGRLQWREPNFGRYPLAIDAPPDAGRFSELLHKVGVAARDANRVEVPFSFIAPKESEYWTFDSSKGVDIPLGRAGATKLQNLKLGKGTSQHVLTAGKTGSGKSTLLHALITNGALRYSPDQLELYLIDFKKGVEFKVYAAMDLPHARVIAVESEREFGLSVLQRLDVELKSRGEVYRELGCQDLAGYREARPEVPMARVLLVVDEFQEFFVEDDKIAQEVTLLLDRLVRQGRAFGMHVILGSQTLGGQYSLPKATLGQMAVRIALQCSEADAHLILSEDNTAARLLTRPGEAIYNDANGMVEGNNLFQVVWLPDANREAYLEKIQEMSKGLKHQKPPPIVFEGNLPADVHKNPLLNQLLELTEWPQAPRADYAWLGDAIAIKDPTAVVFRPQSGSNVLIVGQNDEAALAMMMMGALGIAAQHPPIGPQAARFYLLDGSPVDSALSGQLGKLKDVLPHPVTNVTWRDLAAVYGGLAAEVKSRQESTAEDQAPIYIFIYDVQRFRDLRKSDDDFGYSRYDEDKPVPPSKLFSDVLRDGPPVGIHTIVWCDSVNNMNRTLDRQGMKEFENRILFQMSSNDSSTLIDTPAASKLGENRALYYSEEENRIEKFRPYGVPEPTWLDSVKQKFAARPKPEVAASVTGNGTATHGASHTAPPAAPEPAPTPHNGHKTDGDPAPPLAESHTAARPVVDDVLDPPPLESL